MKILNNIINMLVTKRYFKTKLDAQIYIVLTFGLLVGSVINFM